MSELVRYEAARHALAEAYRVDEVKDILDRATAMEKYAIQAKDTELSRHATEIRLRAERRLGELMAEQPKASGTRGQLKGRDSSGGTKTDPPEKSAPTLVDQGIDKHLADRARKAAAMPEAKYEAKIARQVGMAEKAASAVGKAAHPKSEFTGEVEWYTPPEYLDAARSVLGGIDLDPASSELAQQTVQAGAYFTVEDNGLAREWSGRVWLNPPYKQPYIADFMRKISEEVTSGRVSEAIALTHNYTDTEWFHVGVLACSAVCFTRGRVKFISSDGEIAAPTQGQAFFYFGRNVHRFAEVFGRVGFVMSPLRFVEAATQEAAE